MPFEAIQLQSMWVMMNMILDQDKDLSLLQKISGPDSVPSIKVLDVSPNEGIFLLTALSNMAISRKNTEDNRLIEIIAVQILEVRSFILFYKHSVTFWDRIIVDVFSNKQLLFVYVSLSGLSFSNSTSLLFK